MPEMLESRDVRLLTEIGFLALRYLRFDDSRTIFAAVKALRPDQEAGHIGAALTDLLSGDIDQAIASLEKLPTSDAARAFLGMALVKQGATADALTVLADVAASPSDPLYGELATEILVQLSKS
jgi:Tetratricopeptide repeat